jgi:hypothetical protein
VCPAAKPSAKIPPEEVPLIHPTCAGHGLPSTDSNSASTRAEYSALMPPPSKDRSLNTADSDSFMTPSNIVFAIFRQQKLKS